LPVNSFECQLSAMSCQFSVMEVLLRLSGLCVLLFAAGLVAQQAPTSVRSLPFSPGLELGDTLYVSGHLGITTAPKTPVDAEEEARLVLASVEGTLKEAGMGMDDLVYVEIYCTDLSLYSTFNKVYAAKFHAPYPARDFIGVKELLFGNHFEVTGIAVRHAGEKKMVPVAGAAAKPVVYSSLHVVGLDGGEGRVVYQGKGHAEAPVFTRDGRSLVFDLDGAIERITAGGGAAETIAMGDGVTCAASKGFSPDGRELAATCKTAARPEWRIYAAPARGGTARVVTENANAWLHTWSPDGKTLAFSRAEKGGGLNVWEIGVDGTGERQITKGPGVSDDPDWSPDGKWIYFHSDRRGVMQIWKMRPDGTGAQQVTKDEEGNWTPHVSPDGRWVVFQSYGKAATGHPSMVPVTLRVMDLRDGSVQVLAKTFGGSGTMNVNSWSPDSTRVAFMSYELKPGE
jgi:enamine deaminase RidA (YjgF/YER057c/UK114 family)